MIVEVVTVVGTYWQPSSSSSSAPASDDEDDDGAELESFMKPTLQSIILNTVTKHYQLY